MSGARSPRAPTLPDDTRNYQAGGVFAQIGSVLFNGFPLAGRFKSSLRVGSGAATLAAFDASDGMVVGDGASAGLRLRDRADSTKWMGWQRNGTIRLLTEAATLWVIDQVTGLIAQDAHTAPTLLNSWVNVGAGFPTAGYRIEKPSGKVELKGVVRSGTGIGSANPIFTLPAGSRPTTERSFPVESNGAFGAVRVATSGNVYVLAGSTLSVYLDGIRFDPSV